VHDAAPGGHPVDGARVNLGFDPEIVAMNDFAVIEISEGRQADMRMRPHVETMPALELRRAEVVEEDERPDGAAAHMRQRAPHGKSVQVDAARDDDHFQCVTGVAIACRRILAGEKTHRSCLSEWPLARILNVGSVWLVVKPEPA
jgi:hypothetical protein